MSENVSNAGDAQLVASLRHVLTDLTHNPYPYVPNPESCKKRASVALILRIRPHASHWPSSSTPSPDVALPAPAYLEQFFAQPWVQNGDPEVVFIKRATRVGDRWTGHVALPGGKRDAEDEDDKAAAVRETSEEIGLDLTSPNALFIGNLPERVVSTAWGKVPIMVLCPFVFLWTKPDVPPFKLQPTEVASTHWVPLRVLLSPSTRTYEYVDVADRFAKQGGPILKTAVRSVIGKMRFSAIRLIPSESLYCSSTTEFFDEGSIRQSSRGMNKVWNWFRGTNPDVEDKATRPLLLWGLTLGMLVDLLDQLPPHNAVELWSHPTFSSLDVRLIVNILTERLKRRNRAVLQETGGNGSGVQNQTAMDSETEAVAPVEKGKNSERSYAVGVMLEGYYDKARLGVWMAVAIRSIGTLAAIMYATRRYRQRHV